MGRDTIFRDREPSPGDFAFDSRVAEVFDDMLERSVPMYAEQQRLILDLAESFWVPGTDVYDLGCSTGTMLMQMCRRIGSRGRLVGYDSSAPMLDRAREKITGAGLGGRVELRLGDLNGPLSDLPMTNASVVTACWTIQFVHPDKRDALIRWIHDGLVDGGALIVAEKVRPDEDRLGRLFTDHYHALKRSNGYSTDEILRKEQSLKGVLIPYRIGENLALFRRNGFETAATIFQWLPFAAFLCVKRS